MHIARSFKAPMKIRYKSRIWICSSAYFLHKSRKRE